MKKNNEYLPINLSLDNKKFLVAGGGQVACRKIDLLAKRGVHLTIVAKKMDPKIIELEQHSLAYLKQKEYEASDLEGMDYVIAATNDADINKRIYDDCQERNILVNVVDDPNHCDFIFPSILRRGPITFTVSTAGKAPFLSAFLRQIMENAFSEEWMTIGEMASKYRKHVRKTFKGRDDIKNECYGRFLDVNWMEMIHKEGEDAAEEYYAQLIASLDEI